MPRMKMDVHKINVKFFAREPVQVEQAGNIRMKKDGGIAVLASHFRQLVEDFVSGAWPIRLRHSGRQSTGRSPLRRTLRDRDGILVQSAGDRYQGEGRGAR